MASPGEAGGRKGGLVNRRSDDGIDVARQRRIRRRHDGVKGRLARSRINLPDGKTLQLIGGMRTVDRRLAGEDYTRIANRFDGDFGANTRWIAHRDGQTWPACGQRCSASQSATILGLALRSSADSARASAA